MRVHIDGKTYTVGFSEEDAAVFTDNTDAPPGVVTGAGAFVFDTRTGDLVDRKGAAQDRDELEWLAFSQDAQDFGRGKLAMQGYHVNPFEFAPLMPELDANPAGSTHPHVGRRVELVRTSDTASGLRPGDQGSVAMVDEDEILYVDWDRGRLLGLMPGIDEFRFVSETNPARISRTRGVKTLKGPYSASKGYRAWIKHRGTLGQGFLTTMTKAQRRKALDLCVGDFGYRSCLGKIMALERAKRGPRGQGEGVGVRYAAKLRAARKYLVETYGGKGSFGPRKKTTGKGRETPARKAADNPRGKKAEVSVGPDALTDGERDELASYGYRLLPTGEFHSTTQDKTLGVVHSKKRGRHQYVSRSGSPLASGMSPAQFVRKFWYAQKLPGRSDNPSVTRHGENAAAYLEEGEQALRAAQGHYQRSYRTKPPVYEWQQACERAKQAWRYAMLALHELEHGTMSHRQRKLVHGGSVALQNAAQDLLDRLGCPWRDPPSPNPYQGDAVELARYRKARQAWERGGRKGPPPLAPRPHTHAA